MSNAKNKHRNIRKGGTVKTVRYHDLLRAKRTQNPLSGLNPAKVRRLYELYREGKYADVQLAWDALEEYDDMLGTVLNRRQSALGEMEWDVLIDARAVGEDAAMQALAEEQQDFITRRLRAVENLSDAIKWLGLADFRRYSALEVLTAGGGERWLPIHHWLLCRPALEGAWCYNENAETSCTRVEPIDMSAVLLREVARPIDLVAMFLISAKEAAIDGWDSFLEVFGNPALFFKMPPGTSDDQRDEYASIIKEISSDGAGVYPDGGEIHTVETSAANADAFSSRAEWCDKALVRRATGGLLTVLAESGSGTLAGSAHMEAFRQIAANDAISIAECINRQYVRRRIAAEFPGEPVLVYFTLTQPMINDRAATVNMLCQLAGQRWRATDEAVSEEVGVEVHTEEAAPQPPMMNTNPHTLGTPPAEPVLNAGETLEKPNREEEPPLTEDELAAFRGLSEPNRERMEQHRAEVEQALRAAADLDGESGTKVPSSDEESSEEEVVANGCNKPDCPKHPRLMDVTGSNRHKQKGSRGSSGNPNAKKRNSNSDGKQAKNEVSESGESRPKERPVYNPKASIPQEELKKSSDFMKTQEGRKLSAWKEKSQNKTRRDGVTFSQVHEPIVSSNKRTSERINELVESAEDRFPSRVLTMQEQSFHHALRHNLSDEEIGLIPAVYNRWNRMTKEKKGNVVFERDFGAETYRLVVSLGGKNKTVGGEHTCNFVTFYRVTQN